MKHDIIKFQWKIVKELVKYAEASAFNLHLFSVREKQLFELNKMEFVIFTATCSCAFASHFNTLTQTPLHLNIGRKTERFVYTNKRCKCNQFRFPGD